ncbi:MAG: hypothetical protein VW437_03370 [Betaproteobacteria bacterium]
MNGITYTKHCKERMQQRAINGQIIEILISFGISKRRKGADVIFLDKQGIQDVENLPGVNTRLIEKASKAYLVEDQGRVITVAFRTKKFKWEH